MTTDQKIQTLDILRRIPFYAKTDNEKITQAAIIAALNKDLTPKEELPLEMTEVFVDAPHIKTTHRNWPEVMTRVEKARENEAIYAIHVTRGGEIEYTWEAEKR